jgi:hypothetical protein
MLPDDAFRCSAIDKSDSDGAVYGLDTFRIVEGEAGDAGAAEETVDVIRGASHLRAIGYDSTLADWLTRARL